MMVWIPIVMECYCFFIKIHHLKYSIQIMKSTYGWTCFRLKYIFLSFIKKIAIRFLIESVITKCHIGHSQMTFSHNHCFLLLTVSHPTFPLFILVYFGLFLFYFWIPEISFNTKQNWLVCKCIATSISENN